MLKLSLAVLFLVVALSTPSLADDGGDGGDGADSLTEFTGESGSAEGDATASGSDASP